MVDPTTRLWITAPCLLCVPLFSAAGEAGKDWPRWRGPNADGVADGGDLPVRWSKTENVRWSAKLPGWGTSSPVVNDRKVVPRGYGRDRGA